MHALSTLSPPPKLVFLTSPGNPTGTCIPIADLRRIAEHPTWRGLIIADEAYMDFADPDNRGDKSAIQLCGRPSRRCRSLQT
jgi:histidinol-phosphate aminotransferase